MVELRNVQRLAGVADVMGDDAAGADELEHLAVAAKSTISSKICQTRNGSAPRRSSPMPS